MKLILFDLPTLSIYALTLIFLCLAHRFRKTRRSSAPQPSGAWPLLGHLPLMGRQDQPVAKTLGAIADKCGPIFSLKLGKNRAIVVSSWELVKECLVTNDLVLATRPKMAHSKYIGYDYAVFGISPYGSYWRHIRKMVTVKLLSLQKLNDLSQIRLSEINTWLKYLYHRSLKHTKGHLEVVDLDECLEILTFNIAITMIVGKRFSTISCDGTDTDGYFSRFRKAIFKIATLSGVFVPSDFIPFIEWMDIMGYIKAMKETHKEVDCIIGYWLDEHIKRRQECRGSNPEGDFMDVMLSEFPEDFVMSGYDRLTIIKATALMVLLPGSGTPLVALLWAVSLLLNHPHILRAAQEEIDSIIGKDKWVQESDIQHLPYLQAVVKESMRLYPSSPFTGIREAMEDCEIGGYPVQKGTQLLINIWKLHRDPNVWSPHPNEFRPERFMDKHAGVDFKGQQFVYLPFGLGRRSCPGMNFGLQIVLIILARLLQGFDISTPNGAPVDMTETLGIALGKKNKLEAVLRPRLPQSLYQAL